MCERKGEEEGIRHTPVLSCVLVVHQTRWALEGESLLRSLPQQLQKMAQSDNIPAACLLPHALGCPLLLSNAEEAAGEAIAATFSDGPGRGVYRITAPPSANHLAGPGVPGSAQEGGPRGEAGSGATPKTPEAPSREGGELLDLNEQAETLDLNVQADPTDGADDHEEQGRKGDEGPSPEKAGDSEGEGADKEEGKEGEPATVLVRAPSVEEIALALPVLVLPCLERCRGGDETLSGFASDLVKQLVQMQEHLSRLMLSLLAPSGAPTAAASAGPAPASALRGITVVHHSQAGGPGDAQQSAVEAVPRVHASLWLRLRFLLPLLPIVHGDK